MKIRGKTMVQIELENLHPVEAYCWKQMIEKVKVRGGKIFGRGIGDNSGSLTIEVEEDS